MNVRRFSCYFLHFLVSLVAFSKILSSVLLVSKEYTPTASWKFLLHLPDPSLLLSWPLACFKKYKNYLLLGIGIILVLGVVVGLIVGLSLRGRRTCPISALLFLLHLDLAVLHVDLTNFYQLSLR